jgi:hypothetical protein
MLDELRNFNEEAMDMEELVELAAFGRSFRSEFEALGAEVPDWVDIQLKSLRRVIRSRDMDRLEKMIREKEARLEALKPAEEKRKDLQEEIDRLKQKLSAVA